MNEYVKSDLYKYYGKDDYLTLIRGYLRNKTFRTQVSIRLSQSNNKGIRVIGKFFICDR